MKNKLVLIMLLMFGSVSSVLSAIAVTDLAVPRSLHVYDVGGNTYVDLVPHGCAITRYHLSPAHGKYNTIVSNSNENSFSFSFN